MNKQTIFKIIGLAPIVGILVIFAWNINSNATYEKAGKASYKLHCSGCHGDNGEGVRQLIPTLIQADYAVQHFDSIPCWISKGMNHPITVNGKNYEQSMYPIDIDEVEMTNIINYISEEFLKTNKQVNSKWVKEKLQQCN